MEIWRLFADDCWFQGLLEARARRALALRGARLAWLGDVMHEALLLLARRLAAKTPDLRVGRQRVDETFPAWIGTIVERSCGEAIQWLTRLDRLHRDLLESIPDSRAEQSFDALFDIDWAIGEQQEPERTMLHLKAGGCSIAEIAAQLDMTYWEVYRRLKAATARLQRQLGERRRLENGSLVRPAFPASSSSTTTR